MRRQVLRPPARQPGLRRRRRRRHPLPVPRLEVRRDRALPRAAVRGHDPPRGQLPRQVRHRGLSRRRSSAASSSPTWARRRRRCCRAGAPWPGTTPCATSPSPSCPATGCSARRTRSTRCTRSGCTATPAPTSSRSSHGQRAGLERTRQQHQKIGFDAFEHGIIKRRVSVGP